MEPIEGTGLDLDVLADQTAGDHALQDELLALFDAQCRRLLPLLEGAAEFEERVGVAHLLKGAAAAIGATKVARAAGALEEARADQDVASLAADLRRSIAEVRAAISRWRAQNGAEPDDLT